MRVLLTMIAAAVLACSGAAAQTRDAGTFDILLLGVKAGELHFAGRVENDRYTASGLLRSTGLLSIVREVSFEATAEGRARGGRLMPTRYTENTDTGSRVSKAEMAFVGSTPQVKRYEPSRDPRPEDVDPSTQAGALDPMTALYAVLRDVPRDSACQLNVPMFDGRRASRVQMSPDRSEADSIDCTGAYVRVAGFSAEDMAERRVFPFTLRYARGDAGLWRVVRVEFQTLYGKARLIRR